MMNDKKDSFISFYCLLNLQMIVDICANLFYEELFFLQNLCRQGKLYVSLKRFCRYSLKLFFYLYMKTIYV